MDCCAASIAKHVQPGNDSIDGRHDLHVFYRESTPTLIRFRYLRKFKSNILQENISVVYLTLRSITSDQLNIFHDLSIIVMKARGRISTKL